MSVESVMELLASGMEIKEIIKEYPFLKKSHPRVFLQFLMKFLADVNQENRIILTRDRDFIELVKLPKYQTPTIIFRVSDQKT